MGRRAVGDPEHTLEEFKTQLKEPEPDPKHLRFIGSCRWPAGANMFKFNFSGRCQSGLDVIPHGPKPFKFTGFGDLHGPKPYKFIGFGDLQGPKPYKFTGFGGRRPLKVPPSCRGPGRGTVSTATNRNAAYLDRFGILFFCFFFRPARRAYPDESFSHTGTRM